MHIFSLLLVCLLALASKAEVNSLASAPSKIEKRWSKSNNILPPVTFIMRDTTVPTDGYLLIYTADGKLAYKFRRAVLNANGASETLVIDVRSNFVLRLESSDDTCFTKSDYVDKNTHLGSLKIKPRGPKADKWYIKRHTPYGEVSYEFDRNYLSKAGFIYIRGSDDQVALITTETRREYWLRPTRQGVKTISLHLPTALDPIFFVALMGLDLTRVDTCGL